jgi:hypothetical protein
MTREQELEQRIAQLELIVLRAAAQSPQLPPPTIIEAAPAKPKKKPKKQKRAGFDRTGTVDDLIAQNKPDIAPVVPLQAVDGALSPLNAVLRELKATQKSVQGIAPLCELDDVLERANVKASVGIRADNVKRAWATIFHFRATDDGGLDLEQARADLADFRQWARDPMFSRALNLDPQLAVAWFIDVLLATNGDLGKDD